MKKFLLIYFFVMSFAFAQEAQLPQSSKTPTTPANTAPPIENDPIGQPHGAIKIDGRTPDETKKDLDKKIKTTSKGKTPSIDVNKTEKTTQNPNVPDGSSASPDGTIQGLGSSPTLTPTPK